VDNTLGNSPIKIIFRIQVPEFELEGLPFYLRIPYFKNEFEMYEGILQ
jgi:hypothetical protein